MSFTDPPLTDAQLRLLASLPLDDEQARERASAEEIAELDERGWIAAADGLWRFSVRDRVADKLEEAALTENLVSFLEDAETLRAGERITGYRTATDAFHGSCDELLAGVQRDRRQQVLPLLFAHQVTYEN